MTAKHAPFPWTLDKSGVYLRDANGIHVAKLHPRNGDEGKPDAEARANAKVLEALGELVEAAEQLVEAVSANGLLNFRTGPSLQEVREKAMNAEDQKYLDEVVIPLLKAIRNIPKCDRKNFLPLVWRLLR